MKEILRLKRRITWLLFSLTSAIFLFTCLITCQLSIERIRVANTELFNSRFSAYVSALQGRHAVDIVETMRLEEEHNIIIQLYDNGRAVIPAILRQGDTREELIKLAEQQFSPRGGFGNISGELAVSVSGHVEWVGEYQIVSAGSAWYGVLMLQSQDAVKAEINGTILLYFVIFLATLCFLFILSRIIAGITAKPMWQAYRGQLEFTATAGHDLRTPTSIIKSSAQIILEDPNTSTVNAEKIVRETDRLTRLVDDMLLLSASEANRMKIEIGEVDAETELILLYEQFTPLTELNGMKLNLVFPDKPIPKVRGDKKRMYQILSVFIENALEYANEGASIAVIAEIEKRHVLLKVRDHGPGIADEDKAFVWGQFYRAEKSRSNKEHFGLGLSIAQKLAIAQNASVWVEDTPNGGATFVLKLKRIY